MAKSHWRETKGDLMQLIDCECSLKHVNLYSPLAKYVVSNQEVSVHGSPVSLLKGAYSLGGVIGNMCLLGQDGESFNIVERGQLCYSAPLYTTVIDDAANRRGLIEKFCFFSLAFLLTVLYTEM